MPGTLYLVATPIGNLEDITLRALRVLKEADLIACEDTRHTAKLLGHYGINKPTISYHEHNEHERASELLDKIEAGDSIAVVSDAGTPLVSDPGFRLVRGAIERRIPVVSLPGPCAFVAALAASGLPPTEFVFAGFLPPRRAARRSKLAEFAAAGSTTIFYEAPHRIKETLADAREVLGDREAVIARELTKIHEEFIRGSISELIARLEERAPRGEMVLLLGPSLKDNRVEHAPRSIVDELDEMMEAEGIDQKSALKRVARARGISKSEAYRLVMAERASRRE